MKRRATYLLEPQGLLDTGNARLMALAGAEIQKCQPPGCSRNGTMRQCYIQTLEGDFIGLCNEASLTKTGRTAPLRDKAAEARDARSRCRS